MQTTFQPATSTITPLRRVDRNSRMRSLRQSSHLSSSVPPAVPSPAVMPRSISCPHVNRMAGFSADTRPRMIRRRVSETAPPSPPTDAPPAKIRRRVRFEASEPQIHEYPAAPADAASQIYFSRDELKQIYKAHKALAIEYRKKHPEVVDAIYSLHGYSAKTTAKSSTMLPSDAQDELTRSDGRGLEAMMAPLISDHRKWAVYQILSIQDRCRQEGCQDEAELLRAWSLKVGSMALGYAQELAQLDAAAVAVDPGKIGKDSNHSTSKLQRKQGFARAA